MVKLNESTKVKAPAANGHFTDTPHCSASESFDGTYPTNVVVTHEGLCTYIPPGIFMSTCKIDITWFPFDDQNCEMKFGSWTYNGFNVSFSQNIEQVVILFAISPFSWTFNWPVRVEIWARTSKTESGIWKVITNHVSKVFQHHCHFPEEFWQIVWILKVQQAFHPKEGIGCIIVPNFNFTTIIVTLDLSTIASLHNGCVQHYVFTRILMSDGFCLQQCAGATFASLAAWACPARPMLGPTLLPSQIYQCTVKPLILKHKTIPPCKKLGLISKLNPEMDPPDCTGRAHSWLKID